MEFSFRLTLRAEPTLQACVGMLRQGYVYSSVNTHVAATSRTKSGLLKGEQHPHLAGAVDLVLKLSPAIIILRWPLLIRLGADFFDVAYVEEGLFGEVVGLAFADFLEASQRVFDLGADALLAGDPFLELAHFVWRGPSFDRAIAP